MILSDYLSGARGADSRLLKFYDSTDLKADFLNDVNIPTPEEILKFQKSMFLAQFNNGGGLKTNKKELATLQKILNNKKNKTAYNFDTSIIKIEQYVEVLNQKSGAKAIEKLQNLNSTVTNLDQTINEMQLFFNNLSSYKNMNDMAGAFGVINKKITQLANYAKKISDSSPTFAEDDFVGKVAWTEYALKGKVLEVEGTEFFDKLIINNVKTTALNTGSLLGYYDLNGNFKNSGAMKEDLMLFNNTDFMISFTKGKESKEYQMTLGEFIEYLDGENGQKEKTIRLTKTGYDAMVKNAITGIQAKATRSDNIKFGHLNINNMRDNDIYGKSLWYLRQIANSGATKKGRKTKYSNILKNEHEHYNALFNFTMAHQLSHVVGKNNKFLLTRAGITDMYSFILEQFKAKRYFYGIDVKLKGNGSAKVAIKYK